MFCNLLPTLNFLYVFYVSTQAFTSKVKIKQYKKKKKEIYVAKNIMDSNFSYI